MTRHPQHRSLEVYLSGSAEFTQPAAGQGRQALAKGEEGDTKHRSPT